MQYYFQNPVDSKTFNNGGQQRQELNTCQGQDNLENETPRGAIKLISASQMHVTIAFKISNAFHIYVYVNECIEKNKQQIFNLKALFQ